MVLILSPAPKRLAPIARHALITAAVMILLGGLSLSWTTDILGGVGLLLAVCVGAIALYISTRSDLSISGVRLLMSTWVAVVGLSMPMAFYEIVTGIHSEFAFDDRVIGSIGEFPFASIYFGNYNDYSAWLCLGLPITMAAFFEAKSLYYKLTIAAINVACISVIFVNTSRASLVYALAVVAIYFIISNSFRMFSTIVFVIAIPLIFIQYQGQILNLYDLVTYRFEVVGALDESYLQRSGLLAGGVQAIMESYGTGVGIGGFEEYINDHYPYLIPKPHNILLEIGVNFGVIPLILFAALFVRLFMVGLFRRELPLSFRVSIMLSAVAVPIVGAVPSQAIGYVYWWVWLATLIAMASTHVPEGQKMASSAPPRRRLMFPRRGGAG